MSDAHRLLPRSSQDTTGEVQRVLKKLENVGGDNLITRLLANSANGFRPYVLMSNALLNRAVLPPRLRELAILVMASHRQVSYEWWEHVRMSADAGVTDTERQHIERGEHQHSSFAPDELLVMRLAIALAAGQGIDDVDWEDADRSWGTDGLLDLILTVGWWGGFVPTVIEALRLDLAVPERDRPSWRSE